MMTIRHQDTSRDVVIAKLLTGYVKVTDKITDIDSFLLVHGTFDADFVAYMVSWQSSRNLTPDGVIDDATWVAIAKNAPTCSTAKNKKSGYTLACQLLVGGNIMPDAIYGSRTKQAVAVFQDAHHLTADGICGPKTWVALIGSEAEPVEPTKPVKFKQPVDYKQGDSRWAKKIYSNHGSSSQTMANSGCGPTAAADVVATLKDPSVTPWTLAQLSMKWGDRTDNSGTSWSFFKHLADYYHFVKMVQTKSFDALKACLDAGGYVVCSMAPGYWTKGGHFITAWKYDDTYVYCNDPASSTRKKQKIAAFKSESKQYFCFYPDLTAPDDVVDKPDDAVDKRGEKIVDISKYQPTVDYDALIGDTALIILRAGYRGTGGGISQDQKFTLHASELRKRNVRFGVYFFSIATNEDKAREEARMFWQYAKGYDPLFWAGDFEKDEITTAAIVEFVDELRKLGAVKVGCYVANHLYNKYDYASIREQMDFTWIPRYGSNPPVHTCDLWQYTSTGTVAGIDGNVDLNKITGEGHNLEWFTDGAEPTPEPMQSYVLITGKTVNVRDEPGTSGDVLGIAYDGDRLPYKGKSKAVSGRDWYEVEFNGKDGWVSSKYAEVV